MACNHFPWTANTVERRRWWHAITSFGQHTQSDDVGRGMPSSLLGSTDRQTASGVACHHRPWTAQMVGHRWVWNAIIALGQHTRSATSGEELNLCSWTVHTVKRRPAWHDITDLGLHARSDDVGRGMTSPPLDSKTRSNYVGRGITSLPLDYIHSRMKSSLA